MTPTLLNVLSATYLACGVANAVFWYRKGEQEPAFRNAPKPALAAVIVLGFILAVVAWPYDAALWVRRQVVGRGA